MSLEQNFIATSLIELLSIPACRFLWSGMPIRILRDLHVGDLIQSPPPESRWYLLAELTEFPETEIRFSRHLVQQSNLDYKYVQWYSKGEHVHSNYINHYQKDIFFTVKSLFL